MGLLVHSPQADARHLSAMTVGINRLLCNEDNNGAHSVVQPGHNYGSSMLCLVAGTQEALSKFAYFLFVSPTCMGLAVPGIEFLNLPGLTGLWDQTPFVVIIGRLLSPKI